MGNQLKKLNCTHHHYDCDDYEPDRKRQKQATANPFEVEQVSITNICFDCLEHIFDFLDLQSLLNVAGTCKWLQHVAVNKFGQRYRKKRVYLDLSNPHARSWIHVHRNEINLSGLNNCFSFLRCFGGKISDLVVNYSDNSDKITGYVDQYINQYCVESLVSMSQVQRAAPIINLQKPFRNVEKLDITTSCLGKHLPKFTNLFPNLRHLEMYYVSFDAATLKNVSFPRLEHLTLIVENSERFQYFTYSNTAKFLRAHRNLQHLNLMLYGKITFLKLLRLIWENRCLTKLSVMIGLGYSDSFVDVNMFAMNQFAVKHRSMIELDVLSFRFTAGDAIHFIRQVTTLKLFKFQVKNRFERDCLVEQLDDEWKHHFWTFNGIFYVKLQR